MAAKIGRHRYGTKLRHCRPMYTWFLGPHESVGPQTASRSAQPFLRGLPMYPTQETDRPRHSIWSNRPHLGCACDAASYRLSDIDSGEKNIAYRLGLPRELDRPHGVHTHSFFIVIPLLQSLEEH